MQSRKFAAALQATGSNRPIYLRVSATSGHGIGSSLSDRIEENADWMSFLFDQLGMKLPAT
jgi:prolyl oligopeptidase